MHDVGILWVIAVLCCDESWFLLLLLDLNWNYCCCCTIAIVVYCEIWTSVRHETRIIIFSGQNFPTRRWQPRFFRCLTKHWNRPCLNLWIELVDSFPKLSWLPSESQWLASYGGFTVGLDPTVVRRCSFAAMMVWARYRWYTPLRNIAGQLPYQCGLF